MDYTLFCGIYGVIYQKNTWQKKQDAKVFIGLPESNDSVILNLFFYLFTIKGKTNLEKSSGIICSRIMPEFFEINSCLENKEKRKHQ